MRRLQDLDLRGRRVLVRVDYNVPVQGGVVADDTRIRASLPTLRALQQAGASGLVLVSHLGRPQPVSGSAIPEGAQDRMGEVAGALEGLLGQEVAYLRELPSSEAVRQQVSELRGGQVALLENIRFEPGETKNDPALCRKLAALADAFVLDAFGSAHRAHASVSGVAALLPHAAGLLLEKEVAALSKLLDDPQHPYVVVMGGAKVSDKLKVIQNLLPRVDRLLLGGGMAYTFIKAQGGEIGSSLLEEDQLDYAAKLLADFGSKIVLPSDVVAANRFAEDARALVVPAGQIEPGWEGMDIGPETRQEFARQLAQAKMVFWNGPLGVFEMPRFAEGTFFVARAMADLSAYTVIGGGDVVSAVSQSGVAERMGHVSTGGGASLEFLEGQVLPGVEAMR
jgi:phosphoglycerate kinase